MKSRDEIEEGLKQAWDKTPDRGILPEEIKNRMWIKITKATIAKQKRNFRWVAAACAVLILSVAGYWSIAGSNYLKAETLAVRTYPQDIRLLRLPDGSRVWLNENTTIEYPENFSGEQRTVILKGEAFFEVAKDPSKPFIITSDGVTTTVLGTSFNVKAYTGTTPEVHVRTGKVKVETGRDRVFLERGDAAIIDSGSRIFKQRLRNPEPVWKKVLVDVDGMTLEQVIAKLQLIYSFKAEYTNDALKKLKIKGTLDTRQGFPQILETVAFALQVKITSAGNDRYIISK